MKHIALATALAFAACSPKAETPAAPEAAPAPAAAPMATAATDAITTNGWGPLKIGMSRTEVIAAVGDKADPNSSGGPDEEACTEFHPARAPDGLYVMLEENTLTRITVTELSKLKTSDGFGLGDDPAAIKTFYGPRAVSTPHQYQDKPAEYVTVLDGPPGADPFLQNPDARGFVYEVDGTGKVGAIHAGGESIRYVEGCL